LATGQTTRLFRPPGGEYNQKNLDFLKTTQYKMILWSWDQDTKDWKGPGVNKIVKKVLKNASDGDIVLFHDTMSQTVKALKVILPQLKKEGYRFVTVSELMQLKPSHSRIF
jgi:peptidoglycan/xylan/chitin deacetylase (PgdA/CDA1 family)